MCDPVNAKHRAYAWMLTVTVTVAMSHLPAPSARAQSPKGGEGSTPAAPSPETNAGAPLWGGLWYHMTADQAAAVLATTGGVREAHVVRKKNKPVSVSVTYVDKGIDVLSFPHTIALNFEGDFLTTVTLTSKQCSSVAVPKLGDFDKLLEKKYGPSRRQNEVTAARTFVAVRFTYTTPTTRVWLRAWNENPALQYQGSVPGSGAAGAIADIFGAISSNAAEQACPNDKGQLTPLEITYMSEARLQADERAARTADEALKEKALDKL